MKKFEELNLRQELKNTKNFSHSFKRKFGHLVDSPGLLQEYPIYGPLLQIRLKRRLIEFEKRQQKIFKAMLYVTFIVKNICPLPLICAEEIVKNFNANEIDEFVGSCDEAYYGNIMDDIYQDNRKAKL